MRVLLVGGGCRGLALTRALVAEDHAVRAVTRTEAGRPAIEAAGAECWIGDPDVVGTLRYALDNVTVLLWVLGTATGAPEKVQALHGSRLRMMLEKTTDTTVRGVVYERAGPLPAAVFAAGEAELRHARQTNEIPFVALDADPGDAGAWVTAARAAIGAVLAQPRGAGGGGGRAPSPEGGSSQPRGGGGGHVAAGGGGGRAPIPEGGSSQR